MAPAQRIESMMFLTVFSSVLAAVRGEGQTAGVHGSGTQSGDNLV